MEKRQNRGFYRDYSNFKPDSYILDLKKANLNEKPSFVEGAIAQCNMFHEIPITNIQKDAVIDFRIPLVIQGFCLCLYIFCETSFRGESQLNIRVVV